MEGKYSIELLRTGGEGTAIEKILVRHKSLNIARALYKAAVLNYSERLIMLCDRTRVLARSGSARHYAGNKAHADGVRAWVPVCPVYKLHLCG